jgi:hypothetical protein
VTGYPGRWPGLRKHDPSGRKDNTNAEVSPVAKRKKAQPWDEVFDRVRGVYFADLIYTPKATLAELGAAEAELGVSFPLSYCEFAQRFGVGGCVRGSVELLLLAPPPENEPPGFRESVVSNTERYRTHAGDPDFDSRMEPQSDVRRLVPFATVDEIADYVFYPPESTDAKWRECRIYKWSVDDGWTPYTDSFTSWLVRVDQRFAYLEDESIDWATRDRSTCVVYKPNPSTTDFISYWADSGAIKTPPAAFDVTLWLAFNNHTVRDLALSIRDREQTDAFPILADALQEAGCTNADLLDSCRTGDPDIDGVWVLQVLLGKV